MSLSVQFLSLLAMIGTGIVAAGFIDMIGTGTSHAGKKSIIRRRAVLLEVIGWVVVGCWSFYVLYVVRDGEWRIYDPFAQLSGILLYASFFHKPFRFFGRILLILFLKPLGFIIRGIFMIIAWVIRLFIRIIDFLFSPLFAIFHRFQRKLFKSQEK
ncbi:spore cortex biosynthesis protein YabQ [Sporosarcina jiandibaonis]|uniref:spore cortex biosynthesis protein YabQ n=1 Tax=Sporosarcina jiandibaonis TaxID=2715535 RepID=UPI0015570B75|nr:spore cortex biosynthesis protein YabQ [Sporosarcina jiandibaonis]